MMIKLVYNIMMCLSSSEESGSLNTCSDIIIILELTMSP